MNQFNFLLENTEENAQYFSTEENPPLNNHKKRPVLDL